MTEGAVTAGTRSVTEVLHPLVQHKLGLLRDVTTTTQMFRQLVNELTKLLLDGLAVPLGAIEDEVQALVCIVLGQ